MTTWKTVSLDRRERTVSSVHPAFITFWLALAVIFGIGVIVQLVDRDWGDALDGFVLAFVFWQMSEKARDVNALMGGHR